MPAAPLYNFSISKSLSTSFSINLGWRFCSLGASGLALRRGSFSTSARPFSMLAEFLYTLSSSQSASYSKKLSGTVLQLSAAVLALQGTTFATLARPSSMSPELLDFFHFQVLCLLRSQSILAGRFCSLSALVCALRRVSCGTAAGWYWHFGMLFWHVAVFGMSARFMTCRPVAFRDAATVPDIRKGPAFASA